MAVHLQRSGTGPPKTAKYSSWRLLAETLTTYVEDETADVDAKDVNILNLSATDYDAVALLHQ